MKKKNTNLHAAKKGKNDEFYTDINDISDELKSYKKHFKGKTVFCNCDDPDSSHFLKFFAQNFDALKLKKVISTHFAEEKPSHKLELLWQYNGKGQNIFGDAEPPKIPLKEDGDFRSPECIELLKESDIVVTNPPFSLFREYVAQLVEYGKKFLIIGNNNAITYKEIFPLIKKNKVWLGTNSNKTMEFRLPDHYKKWGRVDESGQKYGNVPAISWFTNLSHKKRNEKLVLVKKYIGNEKDYPKYVNYDAINVDKVVDIPKDYYGAIGVPITFLCKFNPTQFKILGTSDNGLVADKYKTTPGLTKEFVDDYYLSGGTGAYKAGNPTAGYYKDNLAKMCYKRIFIVRKK